MLHTRMRPEDIIAQAMPGTFSADARMLMVGDVFPDIWADSTVGGIEFHDWARGHYTIFFNHASAYSDVAEADMVALAQAQADFSAHGTRLMGLCQSDSLTERMWLDALEERAGVEIAIPVLSDEDGRIAEICGIDTQTRRSRMPKAKTFVIGPDLRILAVSAYAAAVRRSPQELLRMLAAMRAAGADA